LRRFRVSTEAANQIANCINTLSETDSKELKRWVGAHQTPQQVAQRCRIILAEAAGKQDKDIARNMQGQRLSLNCRYPGVNPVCKENQ
jgi:hypothetical protein